MLCRSAAYSAMFNLFIMKQNFSISFSARFLRAVQLCALLGILLSFSSNYAWGECYIVQNGASPQTYNTKNVNTVIYSAHWTNGASIESISCNVSGYYTKVLLSEGYGMDFDLQCSSDGSNWTNLGYYSPKTSKNASGTISASTGIPADASYVRIITTTGHGGANAAKHDYSASNINIQMKSKLVQNSNSLVFSQHVNAGKSANCDYTGLKAFAMNGATISGTCSNSLFTIQSTIISDCESELQIPITFSPTLGTAAGEQTGTVTLTCGEQNFTFTVSATVTEAVITSIKWDQSFTSLLSINNPADTVLNATVVDPQGNPIAGAAVTYSSADNNVVSIINGNVLHIVGDGRTTITATYRSDNEEVRTSSSNTKQVFVSDGRICVTNVVDQPSEKNCNSAIYIWNAPAQKLSLQYKKLTFATLTGKMYVDAYDGSGNKTRLATLDNSSTSWQDYENLTLDRSYRRIEVTASTESGSHSVQNVTITQATYLEKITTDLGSVSGDNSANASINFKYSNVPTAISASLSGESEIAVSATPVGNGCGDWKDNATINLVFTPKSTGKRQYTYSGNVVLSAGANEGLKTIEIPVNITIDMPFGTLNNGLAMLYKDEEIVLDTHTSAYWAEWNVDNTTLSIQAIDGKNVAAEMPVLLVGDGTNDFYTFTVEENPTLTPEANNAFYYTSKDETAVDPVVFFVLGVKDGVAAFYKFTGEVPAGKVVLKMTKTDPQAAVPARIDIELNEQTATALRPVYADEQADMNGQIFTIMGLPVSSMDQPGIYIMNGKKYIVR